MSLVLAIALPKAGPLAAPIGAYGLVIGVMAWRAAARVEGPSGALAWVGLLGAALFAFSDSMIAVDRFVQPVEGAAVDSAQAAQALVALSVAREASAPSAD